VLDRQTVVLPRRRFAVLKTVAGDAADARLARGPVGVDVDARRVGPFTNGNPIESECRLSSEELPWSQPRRVLLAPAPDVISRGRIRHGTHAAVGDSQR